MVIFIYGADNFNSKKRLEFLKSEFIKKYQDINVVSISADKIQEGFDFMQHLNAIPFLADKRMVILKNFLTDLNKESLDWLASKIKDIPEHTVLVIYESGESFDKRLFAFKQIQKIAKVEYFKKAGTSSIRQLVEEIVLKENMSISDEAMNLLVMLWDGGKKDGEESSKNLHSLKNDLEKIVLLLKAERRQDITDSDISANVTVSAEAKIFDLIDYIGKKKIKKAIKEMDSLFEIGENEYYIISMIIYQFRLLLKIKSLTYAEATQDEIKARLKIHPFVLNKALDQVKNYTLDELKGIYLKLMMLEEDMKKTDNDSIISLSKFIAEVSR